jgi:Tol biopolymer transport system component
MSAVFAQYSPDGKYIIYTNYSDGGKLYRKNANDTSNGEPITSQKSMSPTFSPDGKYIVYKNAQYHLHKITLPYI